MESYAPQKAADISGLFLFVTVFGTQYSRLSKSYGL